MQIKKLTPILVVDAIEPALAFWTESMGFEERTRVPHGDAIGFVILGREKLELMLQSKASVAADLPQLAGASALLYADVASLDAAIAELGERATLLVGPRETFYGAREIWVRDGAGSVIGLAETK
jgi:uncharacterized glyoxalase superfamily protein PhnB